LNHLIPLLDEEVKPRTNSSAQQFFKNVTAANFRLQHLSPHLTISSYYICSPVPSDLVQPKNESLVRLMICGETCNLLLTSSIAFLVIMWCSMVKRLVPMWNKERHRMKTER
jgi:hypothetical protein